MRLAADSFNLVFKYNQYVSNISKYGEYLQVVPCLQELTSEYLQVFPCLQELTCESKCNKVKDCGRHSCKKKCCPSDCLPCDKQCGKTLPCRNHKVMKFIILWEVELNY